MERKGEFLFCSATALYVPILGRMPNLLTGFLCRAVSSALELCGSRSGREINKAVDSGLTPIEITPGITSFAEARMVLECKKIYFQDINPAHVVDSSIADLYPARDYHRMYIGEIVHAWAHRAE